MTERGKLVLFVLMTLMWTSRVEGYTCDKQSLLTVCPFPVLLGPGRNFTVTFNCRANETMLFLNKLAIGVRVNNNYWSTAYKFDGETPKYIIHVRKYTPTSPTIVEHTES
ncbi:hypothetical protein ACOMHN_043138 [Nucella lapillus]